METQGLNLFIVDDNKLMVSTLKSYLTNRFGTDLRISTFHDGESALEKLSPDTHMVILDYYMEGKNGLDVLKSIKAVNPHTEVIMLSGNEDMGLAVESFRAGAKDYVVKGAGSWRKLNRLVYFRITEPVRRMVREFGVSKYIGIFLIAFAALAAVTFYVLFMPK
jgi:DNA-binding NtrC family response regulator